LTSICQSVRVPFLFFSFSKEDNLYQRSERLAIFLTKTGDPRISMLRRFAKAMGVPLEELVAEPKKKSH
jgi:hypothetical protein